MERDLVDKTCRMLIEAEMKGAPGAVMKCFHDVLARHCELKKSLAELEAKLGMEPGGLSLDGIIQIAKELGATPVSSDAPNAEVVKSITCLGLCVRTRNVLDKTGGIHTLRELCEKTESELLGIPSFGLTSLLEVKEKLDRLGLKLRDE